MERLIYSNYDLDDSFDETKKFIMEEYPELCVIKCEDENGNITYEPTDATVWDFINDDDEMVFDNLMDYDFDRIFADKYVLSVGSIGRWDGTFSGWEVGTFGEVFNNIMTDCDYLKLTDNDGDLQIECSHHDGTNYATFRILTDKGYELYDNWNYYRDNRTAQELCNALMTEEGLTEKVNVWQRLYE